VYERVAPSGSNPQLEVELSPSIFTGAGRKAQHVSTVSTTVEAQTVAAKARPFARNATKTVKVSNVVHHRVEGAFVRPFGVKLARKASNLPRRKEVAGRA
jgi:hypothetical protein